MLPRYHIISGAILTLVLYFLVPGISFTYLGLLFFSSFLIDFDHYVTGAKKAGSLNLQKIFEYHKRNEIKERNEISRGIRKKGDFHLFHTIEFHSLIGILGFFWIGFFYIFIGMVFHSLIDIYSLVGNKRFHRREFFLSNWILKQI